ncbi:hypothetical protein [Flagellimonas sp.]|uniref:hypothetical protein n=1 Tax=Flagellimonas sp. TaxID=2058762 RepID=UPI003B51E152
MKFEIPFEEKTYLNQIRLVIPVIYSGLRIKIKRNITIGVFLILVGILLLQFDVDFGGLPIIIGPVFLYQSYRDKKSYLLRKSTVLGVIHQELDSKREILKKGIFEFRPNSLFYKDELSESNTPWSEFEGFKVIERNVLMIVNQKEGKILVIGEKEVGNKDFNTIVGFLESKI